jgi:type II secretory ATPase GspE/PulE/Tfp pilus assembly ATPase PilB-like protein
VESRYAPDRAFESLIDTLSAGAIEDVRVLEEKTPEAVNAAEFDSAPVVKLTNLILQSAIGERASDVHMEPGTGGSVVRFRVDGVLRTHMQLPNQAMRALCRE